MKCNVVIMVLMANKIGGANYEHGLVCRYK